MPGTSRFTRLPRDHRLVELAGADPMAQRGVRCPFRAGSYEPRHRGSPRPPSRSWSIHAVSTIALSTSRTTHVTPTGRALPVHVSGGWPNTDQSFLYVLAASIDRSFGLSGESGSGFHVAVGHEDTKVVELRAPVNPGGLSEGSACGCQPPHGRPGRSPGSGACGRCAARRSRAGLVGGR